MVRDCRARATPRGTACIGAGLIVLRERLAQTPVHDAEHYGVGEHLRRLAGARRESQENARRQEDKQQNRDDNVKVHL